jgi:magnesium transporter
MNATKRLSREMGRLFKTPPKEKRGLFPGALVFVGEKRVEEPKIRIIDYDLDEIHEWKEATVQECVRLKETSKVSWINVNGLSNVEMIKELGEAFGLHPLALEDLLNTGQRPKIEDYEDYLFIVVKMISYDEKENIVDSEQVSMVLGSNYVISFQEREGDCFERVRDRIRNSKGRIRKMGPDYLAYSLLDSIIDNYFEVMEGIGNWIERIDLEISSGYMVNAPRIINSMKKQLLIVRKSLWPVRELINSMVRSESPLITDPVVIFIRDIYDHTVELIETMESFRDVLSGLLDLHMSSVSNRMNEVMKTLTIIATIFIPLTFIAGIYGMNFANMPELNWDWGYYVVWIVMISLALLLVLYFRRKHWI